MTTYANPGAIGNVVTVTKIESTWGNAIRDRVVQNFVNAAARDAAITSPVVGMMCCILDGSGVLQLQQYAGATDGWRQPWNEDWGFLGRASATSTQSTVTTIADLTSLTVAFTAVANRRYKVKVNVLISSTVAADGMLLTLADGSNNAKQGWNPTAPAANAAVSLSPEFVVTGLAAGAQTLKLRLSRSSGTGSLASSASSSVVAEILVYDDGPNGAQS